MTVNQLLQGNFGRANIKRALQIENLGIVISDRATGRNLREQPQLLLRFAQRGGADFAAAAAKMRRVRPSLKFVVPMVSNALAKDKRFKRIGRGQYERVG